MASAPAGAPPRSDNSRLRSRPIELEDGLNRFVYHPLAAKLAWLLRPTGVSPNAVSVASGLLVCAAAFAYTELGWPQGVLIGFACHLIWHVVDGADGDLARMTGKASATGELVDGVCDYAGHIVMYVAFAAILDNAIGGWAWVLAVAAGASHIVQTNHAESQRRTYLWWAYGVPWLKNAQAADDAVFANKSWFSLTFGWMAGLYIRLSAKMTPGAGPIDAALAAAAGDPKRTRHIRLLVRRSFRTSLKLQKALGANPKTILIGISMALGSPIYYFLTMIFALNLLLLFSVRHHNRCGRRLAAAIARG
jgi:phosphatidylserine synthase